MTDAEQSSRCEYCHGVHRTVCPMIKSIEYFPDGKVKLVVFVRPEPISLFESVFGRDK